MGKIKVFSGYLPSTLFQDEDRFKLGHHDKTTIFFGNESRDHVEIDGKGFAFKKGELAGGTITAMRLYNNDGDLLVDARNLSIKSSVFNFYYDHDGQKAFDYVFAVGADVMLGSDEDDVLMGHDKNDRLYGKGGDDFFFAQGGADIFYGGEGSDQFYFDSHFKRATVADFDDAGNVQDRLFTNKSMYMHMKVEQIGKDTVLHFENSEVTLLDFKAKNIDRSDFNLNFDLG
jgi:Ca2+-binding RTX toxin-like protein